MTNDDHKPQSAISYSKIDAALKTPSHSETKRPIAVQSEPNFIRNRMAVNCTAVL